MDGISASTTASTRIRDTLLNLTGIRKLQLFHQAEAAECGLACLGMIAAYHGRQTDLAALRRQHPVSLKGATLNDIITIADHLGLGARAVRCELEELCELRTPAILHWNMNHFVVLESASRDKAVILDPARGRVSMKFEDVSRSFTGVALELSPTAKFERKREKQPIRLFSLVRIDSGLLRALGQGLVLSLVLQGLVLVSPYFMQLVIDEAILKGDHSLLTTIALGFALLKVFEVATTIVRGLVFQYLSNVLVFDMKASLFHHLIRLPVSYFHRRHVGDVQQRFLSLQPICDFVINGAIAACIDGVLAISIAFFLFAYSAGLALLVVGGLVLYLILRLAFLQVSMRISGDALVAQAKESSRFLETLRAIQAIKLANGEDAREGQWRNLAADWMNATIRLGNIRIGYNAISQAILGLSTILVVYIAASAAMAGEMTVGVITAFLAYKNQLEQRAISVIEQLLNWRMLDVQLERVADIALHEREPRSDVMSDMDFGGQVDIVRLGFRYAPLERDVLQGVSLSVKPGQFVAIHGPSGSGKSSLLKVIAGLYPQSYGAVLYDGKPLRFWGLHRLREQLGVVMQDDTLMAGSIAENIASFDEFIDMDRVKEAAQIACIHEEIGQFPMGYQTLVGDMGSSLSGGQQQRIMLARALYKRPKVLIMDEGTAHLDVAMENRINENLKALAITRIVAAHRPETIGAADFAFEMGNAAPAPSTKIIAKAASG